MKYLNLFLLSLPYQALNSVHCNQLCCLGSYQKTGSPPRLSRTYLSSDLVPLLGSVGTHLLTNLRTMNTDYDLATNRRLMKYVILGFVENILRLAQIKNPAYGLFHSPSNLEIRNRQMK